MTEVCEITRKECTCARSVTSDSVSPSARYSLEGSPERFCRGSTATEWMCREALPDPRLLFSKSTKTKVDTDSTARIATHVTIRGRCPRGLCSLPADVSGIERCGEEKWLNIAA